MAYFPFYMEVSDRTFLIVGAGEVALKKLEVLSLFDTKIIIVGINICDGILKLSKDRENIQIEKREYREEDLYLADYIIAATNDPLLNSIIYNAAKNLKKLVNVVDVKAECDYIFPSVIKDGDLVISVSTGGKNPLMAVKIKEMIREILPENISNNIEIVGRNREYIKKNIKSMYKKTLIHKEIIEYIFKKNNITDEVIKEIVRKYQEG